MTPRLLPCLLASLLAAPRAGAEIIERVIAKVGGEILTLSEFEARQLAAVQAARVGPESVERFLRENNQRLLQEAIDDLLLVQRASELGLRVRGDYIDQTIEDIKKDNNIRSEEAFLEQLRREGMSLDELRRSIERSVLRRQVLSRELESKVNVSDAEALREFEAHRADYGQPANVRLAEIVTTGDDPAPARALVARARAGEDFAALARAHSTSSTAGDGGELGRVARGDLAADLEAAVFALAPGGVTDPLRTAAGFRILKVIERSEAQAPSFETARALIVRRLTQQRMAEQYEAYMSNLRKASGAIDVRVREVPLQVTVPDVPTLATPAPRPADATGADEEIVASPQAAPERVAPEPPPGAAPQPTPPPDAHR